MSVTSYEITHAPRRQLLPWRQACRYDGQRWPCPAERALRTAGRGDGEVDAFIDLVDALGDWAPAWARRMR
ncbi:hypothetical protein AB0F72_15585 [Actinoplanes sp. NPDC023936]|uniref:hypothetical protein n=1 Tax=Actinoplanes sp. NPDC023936 TaxID=3154910 RepID=UPI0033DAAE53